MMTAVYVSLEPQLESEELQPVYEELNDFDIVGMQMQISIH